MLKPVKKRKAKKKEEEEEEKEEEEEEVQKPAKKIKTALIQTRPKRILTRQGKKSASI